MHKRSPAEERARREPRSRRRTPPARKYQLSESNTVQWLSDAIGQATRSAKFCVAGCLPAVDPGLEVEGLGPLAIPLKRGMAKELIACCHVAPYGKGSRTLVNKRVRNTFELDPKKFRLSDAWNAAIATEMQAVAQQLGLPPGSVAIQAL